MKEIGNNAVELTDEELAKVVGGFNITDGLGISDSPCPNGYSGCCRSKCANPKCPNFMVGPSPYFDYCLLNIPNCEGVEVGSGSTGSSSDYINPKVDIIA